MQLPESTIDQLYKYLVLVGQQYWYHHDYCLNSKVPLLILIDLFNNEQKYVRELNSMEKGALSHSIFIFHHFLIRGLITLAANIGMFSIVKKNTLSFQNIFCSL